MMHTSYSPHYYQLHTITSFQPWTDSTIKLPVTPLYNARATEAPKCLATITAFMEDSTHMGTEYVHKTHTTEHFKTISLFPSGGECYIIPTLHVLT